METTDPSTLAPEYDVIVGGAGPAGIAAAVAAARAGQRTLLHTRETALGGFASGILVHSLCGLHLRSPDPIPRPANGGFALEFAERLVKSDAACGPVRVGPFDILLNEPIPYTRVCHELCSREQKLTVATGQWMEEVEGSESLLESVKFEGRDTQVRGKVFVDTTREAETAFLGGAEYETAQDRPMRSRTFIFHVSGQDANATDGEGLRIFSERLVAGIRNGRLTPQIALAVISIERIDRQTCDCIRLDDEGYHFSILNPESLIRFQILGDKLAAELAQFLRDNVPGFEKCQVAVAPSQPCAPESRRVSGRHRLAPEDLQTPAVFEDAVCRLGWPLMADPMVMGEALWGPVQGISATVPLRSLLSKNIDNLIVAGRCISSAYSVQGSVRVAGTALALGQAAGLAAAMAAVFPGHTISPGAEAETAAAIRSALEEGL